MACVDMVDGLPDSIREVSATFLNMLQHAVLVSNDDSGQVGEEILSTAIQLSTADASEREHTGEVTSMPNQESDQIGEEMSRPAVSLTTSDGGSEDPGPSHMSSTVSHAEILCHCGATFTNKTTLRRHKRQQHADKYPFKCQQCEGGYNTKRDLEDHNRKIHGAPKLLCRHCMTPFSTWKGLQLHSHQHTPSKHVCSLCNLSFESKMELVRHQKTHTTQLTCRDCGKTFTRSCHLKEHVNSIHGNDLHHCNLCEFKTKSKRSLKRHMDRHVKTVPHLCTTCGKGFSRKDYAVKHEEKCVYLDVVLSL